jgi:hypothetical protein
MAAALDLVISCKTKAKDYMKNIGTRWNLNSTPLLTPPAYPAANNFRHRDQSPRSLCVSVLLFALLFGSAMVVQAQGTNEVPDAAKCLTPFKRQVVDAHQQRYGMSCIPMSVEMVLKLLDRVPQPFYELQEAWKEKADGNFNDFDGKSVKGVTFHKQFGLPRNSEFPFERLFATIDSELKAGRFVIVSLASSQVSWHMYVIFDEDPNGDFVAVSKIGSRTIDARRVKETIRRMKGTDILTYEVEAPGAK